MEDDKVKFAHNMESDDHVVAMENETSFTNVGANPQDAAVPSNNDKQSGETDNMGTNPQGSALPSNNETPSGETDNMVTNPQGVAVPSNNDTQSEETATVDANFQGGEENRSCDEETNMKTKRVPKLLKLIFQPTFEEKSGQIFIHPVKFVLLLLQFVKVVLLTRQVIDFGNDYRHFSEVVNRGHLTLRHLMLEQWDAAWEHLAYPPPMGQFAVYTIKDMESGINFAVEGFMNADNKATGNFVRTQNDSMMIHVTYFDFPGFVNTDTNTTGLRVNDQTFPVENGLTENNGLLSYDIKKEFEAKQIKQPFKRLLSTTLEFSLHSVRIHATEKRARCLRVKGWVTFKDPDNNGQVTVNLETLTSRIKCKDLNLPLTDYALEKTDKGLARTLLGVLIVSILTSASTIVLSAFLYWKTKKYFGEHEFPASEYMKFIKIWHVVVIVADIFTLIGTVWILQEHQQGELIVETLDSYTVFLGFGSILAWISNLRFFNFSDKFQVLFMTLRRALPNVVAFLICALFLFVGFWISGYVVLGPYHVKFSTLPIAAETLFSVVYGDEIFATMAILETNKTGGHWVWWFSRFYIGTYVSVFTIVIINLLIAIYNTAYEAINNGLGSSDFRPIKKALRIYMMEQGSDSNLHMSICGLLDGNTRFSNAERNLLKELQTLVDFSESKRGVKQKTLKAFWNDGKDNKTNINCGPVSIITFQ